MPALFEASAAEGPPMVDCQPAPSGRGAGIRPPNPHLSVQHTADEAQAPAEPVKLRTRFYSDESQSIVSRNESPDIPFRWSVNPYRGCEHGCAYCYARPTHEYLGLDAGLGFETQVLVKHNAALLLRKWLARPAWNGEPIVFSGVTDCYQPAEREHRVTRACLEVAEECGQPVGIVTKNALVTRDKDLLASLAERSAAAVALSITTLDEGLARRMEPRTSTPSARLRAVAELVEGGVPVHVVAAPVIPGLNDHELPAILAAAREAGASSASYTLLRLPGSVREVFLEWLARCEPRRATRVATLLRGVREGGLSSSRFGERMSGVGPYAAQIARTFRVFAHRNGLNRAPQPLSSAAFRPPRLDAQRRLF
ncbi:MAG: PA0069 family radical SAM protein [Lacipirellulaceae bacterium]